VTVKEQERGWSRWNVKVEMPRMPREVLILTFRCTHNRSVRRILQRESEREGGREGSRPEKPTKTRASPVREKQMKKTSTEELADVYRVGKARLCHTLACAH
jgi:hypothetical protein